MFKNSFYGASGDSRQVYNPGFVHMNKAPWLLGGVRIIKPGRKICFAAPCIPWLFQAMANLATKAPDITPEVAREFQRRATISRLARIEREKAEERQRDIEARALAISREKTVTPEEARKTNVQLQIDATLDDLSDCEDPELRIKLTASLDKLWSLVYPKVGASRPDRKPRRSQVEAQPIETPQTPQENMREIKHSSEIKPIRDMSQEM